MRHNESSDPLSEMILSQLLSYYQEVTGILECLMTIQVHVQYGRLSVKSEGVQNVPKIVVNMEHVMMESVDVPHNIVARTVQKVSMFFLLMKMSLVVQPRELFQ